MILFVALLISELIGEQLLEDLSGLRWQNRIIVLNDMENQATILRLLESKQKAIDERDVLWFVLAKNHIVSNYKGQFGKTFVMQLRKQYSLQSGQVILIGKDGGLKSSFDGINLNVIFSEIDAMPMRQREMQQ